MIDRVCSDPLCQLKKMKLSIGSLKLLDFESCNILATLLRKRNVNVVISPAMDNSRILDMFKMLDKDSKGYLSETEFLTGVGSLQHHGTHSNEQNNKSLNELRQEFYQLAIRRVEKRDRVYFSDFWDALTSAKSDSFDVIKINSPLHFIFQFIQDNLNHCISLQQSESNFSDTSAETELLQVPTTLNEWDKVLHNNLSKLYYFSVGLNLETQISDNKNSTVFAAISAYAHIIQLIHDNTTNMKIANDNRDGSQYSSLRNKETGSTYGNSRGIGTYMRIRKKSRKYHAKPPPLDTTLGAIGNLSLPQGYAKQLTIEIQNDSQLNGNPNIAITTMNSDEEIVFILRLCQMFVLKKLKHLLTIETTKEQIRDRIGASLNLLDLCLETQSYSLLAMIVEIYINSNDNDHDPHLQSIMDKLVGIKLNQSNAYEKDVALFCLLKSAIEAGCANTTRILATAYFNNSDVKDDNHHDARKSCFELIYTCIFGSLAKNANVLSNVLEHWATINDNNDNMDEKSDAMQVKPAKQTVSKETKLLKRILECIDSDTRLRSKQGLIALMIQENYEKAGFKACNNIDSYIKEFQQEWLLKQVVPILLRQAKFAEKCSVRWILMELATKNVSIPSNMELLDCICSTIIIDDSKESVVKALDSHVWDLAIQHQRYEMYVYLFDKYVEHIKNGNILSKNINSSIVNFFTQHDAQFLESQKVCVLKFFDVLAKNVDTLIVNKLHPLEIESLKQFFVSIQELESNENENEKQAVLKSWWNSDLLANFITKLSTNGTDSYLETDSKDHSNGNNNLFGTIRVAFGIARSRFRRNDETVPSQKEIREKINDRMTGEERAINKILLLGTGSSGTTTIHKALQSTHTGGTDQNTLMEIRHVIRQNVIMDILMLLRASQELFDEDQTVHANCQIVVSDDLRKIIEIVVNNVKNQFTDITDWKEMYFLGQAIKILWKLPQIQATFNKRGGRFSSPDNMDYFLNNIENIVREDYTPTEEDFLKMRLQTTGK